MLTLKEINKIRTMYYEQNHSVVVISRIMKISRQTIYKYLKFVDFSTDITSKKNKSKFEKYKDDIIKMLTYDRLHHHKQHHTGTKVYNELKEKYQDFNASKYATIKYFSRLKKEFYYKNNGYLPLAHKPKEAQVDLGDCSFFENDVKVYGKYIVLTFSYSNASYMQLLKNKNSESITNALRNIFEYLNGVPHTIWFDNEPALVRIINQENKNITRILSDSFKRFKMHYEFKEVFMNPDKGNEKRKCRTSSKIYEKKLTCPTS